MQFHWRHLARPNLYRAGPKQNVGFDYVEYIPHRDDQLSRQAAPVRA